MKNPNKQNKKPDACKEHELSKRLPFYNRMATPERKKAGAAPGVYFYAYMLPQRQYDILCRRAKFFYCLQRVAMPSAHMAVT